MYCKIKVTVMTQFDQTGSMNGEFRRRLSHLCLTISALWGRQSNFFHSWFICPDSIYDQSITQEDPKNQMVCFIYLKTYHIVTIKVIISIQTGLID